MKRLLFLGVLLLSLTLVACSEEATPETNDPIDQVDDPNDPVDQPLELTLEELAYYDGKDGKPAYIAVQGKIYDVTNSSFWRNGGHNGYQAGQDLTDAIINQSPHGLSNLENVPMIGTIISGD